MLRMSVAYPRRSVTRGLSVCRAPQSSRGTSVGVDDLARLPATFLRGRLIYASAVMRLARKAACLCQSVSGNRRRRDSLPRHLPVTQAQTDNLAPRAHQISDGWHSLSRLRGFRVHDTRADSGPVCATSGLERLASHARETVDVLPRDEEELTRHPRTAAFPVRPVLLALVESLGGLFGGHSISRKP